MERLFINPSDDVSLPEEYHFSHNIAVGYHDDLVWLLKNKNIQKKFSVKIKYNDGDKRLNDDENDILKWLIDNGYKQQVDELTSKQISAAIISDICHFIHQALDSAKKLKMSVAFTLIRKPFLENLLIIEQLLANETDFLARFEMTPEGHDPGKIKYDHKKKIISECVEKVNFNAGLSAELICEIRYSKDNYKSFYCLSNLATHLVTTRHPEYKTEKNNLNFIFSSYDSWIEQLQHFYLYVPYILYYAVEVIDRFLLEKNILNKQEYNRRKFQRFTRFILHYDQFNEKSLYGKTTVNQFAKTFKVVCKNCKKRNIIYKSDLFSLVHNRYILCKHCLLDLFTETNSMDDEINTLYK